MVIALESPNVSGYNTSALETSGTGALVECSILFVVCVCALSERSSLLLILLMYCDHVHATENHTTKFRRFVRYVENYFVVTGCAPSRTCNYF